MAYPRIPKRSNKRAGIVDAASIDHAELGAQVVEFDNIKRMTSGHIIVGQGAVDVTSVAMNGDATMDENGTVTIADDAVAPANILGFAKDSAGVTAAALTAAIGAPGTLNEGAIYVVKDTADADKIKLVAVKGGAFYVGAALTAAA